MAGAFGGLLFRCWGVEASPGEPLGVTTLLQLPATLQVAILLQLLAPHQVTHSAPSDHIAPSSYSTSPPKSTLHFLQHKNGLHPANLRFLVQTAIILDEISSNKLDSAIIVVQSAI